MTMLRTLLLFYFAAVAGFAEISCTKKGPPPLPRYNVGVGKRDVTGPISQVNMMGYVDFAQNAYGLHTRLWARAFVIEAGTKRIAYVNVDICTISHMVKREVVAKLQKTHGMTYKYDNVCLVATHTHSAPGGYMEPLAYQVSSLGVVDDVVGALVSGIVAAIEDAEKDMRNADIFPAIGEVHDASINRSPSAYEINPKSERDLYTYDVDKEMTLLRFSEVADPAKHIGSINWFAVHGTSLNKTNRFVSGDNKGYAAQLMEQHAKESHFPNFVAAFSQANEGDVTPNIAGAFCSNTNKPCNYLHSTCDGENDICNSRGPNYEEGAYESGRIIGERQFRRAAELFLESYNSRPLVPTLDYRHAFINMEMQHMYDFEKQKEISTCRAAFGYSFGGGTTDGPSGFPLRQGDTHRKHWFWDKVRAIFKEPTRAQMECHHPKPILLDVGNMHRPYPWTPSIAPIQLLRIGTFYIAAVPAEFTTMSGRRLRKVIRETLIKHGKTEEFTVVIAGLANDYLSYVTTQEEYSIQRYEGGSTLFGPNTLNAYLDAFAKLAESMQTGRRDVLQPGFPPTNESKNVYKLQPGPIFDMSTPLSSFGTVLKEPARKYHVGEDTVSVTFLGSNPRNQLPDYAKEDFPAPSPVPYFTVQRYESGTKEWVVVTDDNDWDTFLRWKLWGSITPISHITITWKLRPETPHGFYRIVYRGVHKTITGDKESHEGISRQFTVTARQYL